MGVYIKDMEMPSIGTYEASIDVMNINGKTAISVYLRDENDSRRFSVCVYEAVHIPPHGRLIDADALKAYWQPDHDREFGADYFIHTIEVAPTIIEAECGDGT